MYACSCHCNFGPKDYHGDLRHPKKKKKQRCMTKFYVKHLYKYLDVAKIIWYHQEHTHEVGSPTHGEFDLESQSLKSWHRNPILIKLKLWIQE